MATFYKDKNGNATIQFYDGKNKRRTLRLGHVAVKTAEAIRSHIEHLSNALLLARPAPRETVLWLSEVGDQMYAKLAKVGLAPPREADQIPRLAAYLDKYIKRRTDLKINSRENLKQARDGLVSHFGEDFDIRKINKGDIGDWHRGLKARGLATATIAGHVKRARMMFKDAADRHVITENPMIGLKAGSMSNDTRFHYVTLADIAAILDAAPDAEWRLIFALARHAGLRVPSETKRLKWPDIDWDRQRMLVHSAKTEHHQGKATRLVPIFPAMMPYLREAFEQADEGAKYVIARHRGENLRTRAFKIIKRAGVAPWEKLFQNMRSSCETDLTATFPLHVACAWVGNSEAVAKRHYLQVTDQHFSLAIGAATGAADTTGHDRTKAALGIEKPAVIAGFPGETLPPRGCERLAKIAGKLGVPRRALRPALRRLKNASPREFKRAIRDLRAGGGE